MIDRIVVHEAVKYNNGFREQKIEIYYRFVGKIDWYKNLSVSRFWHSDKTISLTKGNRQGTSRHFPHRTAGGSPFGFGGRAFVGQRGGKRKPFGQYAQKRNLCLSSLRKCHQNIRRGVGVLLRGGAAPTIGRTARRLPRRHRGKCRGRDFCDGKSPHDQGTLYFLFGLCHSRPLWNGQALPRRSAVCKVSKKGQGQALFLLQSPRTYEHKCLK